MDTTKRIRGRSWMAIRAHVLRANPLCVACQRIGRLSAAVQVDHIEPLHKGGSNDTDNLQGLCHNCHVIKTATELGHRVVLQIGADGWPIDQT